MRKIVWLSLVLAVACTKHNPEACCSTADQCTSFGLPGITGCEGNDVCNSNGACVAPACTTNTDCTDPSMPSCENGFCVAMCGSDADCSTSAPFCENHVCVAACGSDADCGGSTPYCAAKGACVACETDAMCTTADAPVCDGSANVCRGCVADSECASGICLESNGTCADATAAVYVNIGGADTGTCPKATPCATMQYAFGQMSGARNVLKVLSTTWGESATIPIDNVHGYIDGSTTTMSGNGSDGLFSIGLNSNVTITGFTFVPGTGDVVADVRMGTMTLYGDTLTANVYVNGGTLVLQHAVAQGVVCNTNAPGGTIDIEDSDLQGINATQCAVTLERCTLDDTVTGGDQIRLGSASAPFKIENNLLISSNAFTDPAYIDGPAGSVFRFNTLVNLSGTDETAQPLQCYGDPIDASNNIIAWHSSDSIQCGITYSLVDSVEALPPGAGNQVGDVTKFFANMANKDFHLAAGSPAIGAGSGSDVTVDHDGNPRPNPAGSRPDVGAFESPM